MTGRGAVIGDALTRHPAVRLVSVTGDTATGKIIAAACAETVKRAHLELGGKAPVVVFDDADVEALVETLKFAGYANTGQDCTASCRVVAGPKIYDDLLSGLVPAVESIKVGDITDAEVEVGPLVSAKQRESVKGFVEPGAGPPGPRSSPAARRSQGQAFTTSRPSSPTSTRRPRSCSERSSGRSSPCSVSPTRTRPWPGPTTSITGLASSVWTRDISRAMRVARRLQYGAVWVNTHFWLTPEMPHGGYKQSGYGKDMSMYSLEDYTQIKHVMTPLA